MSRPVRTPAAWFRSRFAGRFSLEALRRPGARVRWAIVGVVVILLCSAPAIVSALPVSTPPRSVVQLLADARNSANVPFTGLVVSRGTLNLPDISTLGNQVVGLLSDTSRLRVWQAGANRFRVDRLTAGGESDVYVSGNISLTWDSSERRLVRQVGRSQLPLPEPPDILPTSLGRQLLNYLPADGRGVQRRDDQRIAGRAAAGLVWRPNDPRSLVAEVRMWIDPSNGLPLKVQLQPTDARLVAFETSFLDLSLAPPDPDHLRFDVRHTQRLDLQDSFASSDQDLTPPFRLPQSIAGLPLRSDARPFIATYGDGAALVAVTAVDDATADSIRQQIDSPGRPPIQGTFGEGTLIEAPMLRALIFSSGDRGYVLAGTVTPQFLEQMALDLVNNPPDRNVP